MVIVNTSWDFALLFLEIKRKASRSLHKALLYVLGIVAHCLAASSGKMERMLLAGGFCDLTNKHSVCQCITSKKKQLCEKLLMDGNKTSELY